MSPRCALNKSWYSAFLPTAAKAARRIGGFGRQRMRAVHALGAIAASNALNHDADITKVQDWLGHANIATAWICDRRRMKVEDSPIFKMNY